MIRLFHLYFPTRTLLLSVSEVCLIALGFLVVSAARSTDELDLWLTYDNGLLKVCVVSAVLVLCMYYYDLYDSVVLWNERETLARLFQVLGTASVILALLYFLYPEARLGRASFVFGIGLAGLSVTSSRHLFLSLNRSGRLAERVVIVGDGSLAASVAREIQKRPELGMRVLGLVSQTTDVSSRCSELPRLGSADELIELLKSGKVNRVIVAADEPPKGFPSELWRRKNPGSMILDGRVFYEKLTGKVFLDSSVSARVLSSRHVWPAAAIRIYKRAASVLFSLMCLLLFAPLMVAIAIAVRAESGGPILFRQRRVGKNRKVFTLYKFRSMWTDGGRNGNFRPTQLNDERLTRVGRWLRRTRLDELPQFYNILKGDMRFVGPRPFAVEEENELAERIAHYPLRWTITPGATGWAQVQLGYCASIEDNREKLAHDLFYVQNCSFGFDLLILLRTTKILLWGRGAR